MNLDAQSVWRAPRWALALLLAGLGTLAPFSIDTYLPAFGGIATSVGATTVQMQQTLSGFLFGFAAMNLFHGALADSFGRRPVVLWGMALFTVASVGCALAGSVGTLVFWRVVQGLSAGAGLVVSRAVIRDLFKPADAQRVMSQVTIFFGIAPAVAPMIGGLLFVHTSWQAIFWFLALLGIALWMATFRLLPETLAQGHRQAFRAANLLRGYWQLGTDRRFLALVLASAIPFNGMFLYVVSAPAFLGRHLGIAPEQFFWFFCLSVGGVMSGAWLSGRLAGRVGPKAQVRLGFAVMIAVAVANLGLNLAFEASAWWAMWPLMLFAFGWALTAPVVTLMVLDLVPARRGMAASMQASIGSLSNALVAGVIAPLVMHSTRLLALASLLLLAVGVVAWAWVRSRMA